LTSLPLLRKVVEDLEAARNNGASSLTLYFTKESHIHTLANLVLHSGLPIANRRIPELDYCVSSVRIRAWKYTDGPLYSHISRRFIHSVRRVPTDLPDPDLSSTSAISGAATLTRNIRSSCPLVKGPTRRTSWTPLWMHVIL